MLTTGNEKTSFTRVLSCAANCDKLKKNLLIFKRKTKPKSNYRLDVIGCNSTGWMCNEIMIERISEVWRKKKGSFCYSAGLLIMDFVKSHLAESVKAAANKMSASLAIILGELTKCLQLLDLSVNKSFKVKVRKQREAWMLEGLHTYIKSGRIGKSRLRMLRCGSCKRERKIQDELLVQTLLKRQ